MTSAFPSEEFGSPEIYACMTKNTLCMYLGITERGSMEQGSSPRKGVRTMVARIDSRRIAIAFWCLAQKKLDDPDGYGAWRKPAGSFRRIYPGRMMPEWVLWYCATRRACRLARSRMQQCGCITEWETDRGDRFVYQETEWNAEKRKAICGTFRSDEDNNITIFGKMEIWQSKRGETLLRFVRCRNFWIVRNPDKDGYVRFFENENGGDLCNRIRVEECCRE